MATFHHFISEHFNPSLHLLQIHKKLAPKSHRLSVSASSSSSKHPVTQNTKRNPKKSGRTSRRLITISTSCGRWNGQWSSDFLLSLRELQLADLAEEGDKNAEVFVSLSVQKHTGFGFSVDGRIITTIKRKCSCCFSSYHREIDTTFDVWVLPSSKDSELELPEIGGSDQVIYVKPGSEADLDSVVQDTIRLIASTKCRVVGSSRGQRPLAGFDPKQNLLPGRGDSRRQATSLARQLASVGRLLARGDSCCRATTWARRLASPGDYLGEVTRVAGRLLGRCDLHRHDDSRWRAGDQKGRLDTKYFWTKDVFGHLTCFS